MLQTKIEKQAMKTVGPKQRRAKNIRRRYNEDKLSAIILYVS